MAIDPIEQQNNNQNNNQHEDPEYRAFINDLIHMPLIHIAEFVNRLINYDPLLNDDQNEVNNNLNDSDDDSDDDLDNNLNNEQGGIN
jgi:hypothetical protein